MTGAVLGGFYEPQYRHETGQPSRQTQQETLCHAGLDPASILSGPRNTGFWIKSRMTGLGLGEPS
jgi:hypothetical protein